MRPNSWAYPEPLRRRTLLRPSSRHVPRLTHEVAMRLFGTLAVAIAVGPCAGCFGFLVDKPYTVDIRNPAPLEASNPVVRVGKNRWACQQTNYPPVLIHKADVLRAWGAPREKAPTPRGETWTYRENWRWCGIWIGLIVPVPVLLPVCETFDHVEFEGDLAVASKSRRPDFFGYVLAFPVPWVPIPEFLAFRLAATNDGGPRGLDTRNTSSSCYYFTPSMPDTPSPSDNVSPRDIPARL